MIKCIVVDDDAMSRMSVKKCVERHPELDFLCEFDSAKEALSQIPKLNPELIFLDVEMPEMTGLEFISALTSDAHVVIISSKAEYAIDAFDFNVTDYLTKPVDFDRFCKSVDRVVQINTGISVNSEEVNNLFIKADSKYVKIKLSEIQYIEALSDYVSIYTDKGRFVLLGTMKGMEAKLDSNQFIRIHRSYIINLHRIESFQEGYVKIEDNQLPVSRGSKENLMNKINLLN
jgi:DNA-binding LytR/AlgR family response regulator